ncbi:MAG: carotenoid biosynthesis protein [Armatimonadaceae bacterium]
MTLSVKITAVILLVVGFFVGKVPLTPQMSWVSSIAILGFAAPTLIAVYRAGVDKRIVFTLLGLSIFALGIEATSILTGFPYSRFVYGDMIGGRVGGLVPWTVPFAWVPLVIGATARLASKRTHPLFYLMCGFYLMAIDLLLDPAAVKLGFWTYEYGSAYYDVPLQNFGGWVMTGTLATVVWTFAFRKVAHADAIATLFLTCAFWSSVCLFKGLYIPAVIGALLAVDALRWAEAHKKQNRAVASPVH